MPVRWARCSATSINVCGAVTDCNYLYVAPCPHATTGMRCGRANCSGIDYTNSVTRDILLSGIYDVKICREVLSNPSMATKAINDIISVIESKESARC